MMNSYKQVCHPQSLVKSGEFHRPPRRRGMALALVLFLVAIAVVIGLTFLDAASTATPLARLLDQRLQARMGAESGTAMVLSSLENDPDWRTRHVPGQWLAGEPCLGGSLDVWADNADPHPAGSASFSPDALAPLRVTAVGDYQGARHKLRCIYTPRWTAPVAVGERLELSDSSLADAYYSREADSQSTTPAKVRLSSNSVGRPNIRLSDRARFTGSFYFPRPADPALAFEVTGSAKVIGSRHGRLPVDELLLPPLRVPPHAPIGADITYGVNTHQVLSSDLACRNFIMRPGSVLRVLGSVNLFVGGDALIDSAAIELENPRYGHDAPSVARDSANNNKQIATAFYVPDEVEVRTLAAYVYKDGKKMRLALYADRGGGPGKLLAESQVEVISGNKIAWHESPVTPTKIPPGTYWLALCLQTGSAGYAYRDGAGGATHVRDHDAVAGSFLSNWGASNQILPRSANIYLTGNVAGKGAKLNVYTGGRLTVQGGSRLNSNTEVPSRLAFYQRGVSPAGDAVLGSSSTAHASFNALECAVKLQESARVRGSVRAQAVSVADSAVLRPDGSGGLSDPGLLIGEELVMSGDAVIEADGGTQAIAAACTAGWQPVVLRGRCAVQGDAYAGPGGKGGEVDVHLGPSATLSGARRNLEAALSISAPPAPAGLSLYPDVNVLAGTTVLTGRSRVANFTLAGNAVAEVRGDVTVLVSGKLDLRGRSTLRLLPDATLTFYVNGGAALDEDCRVNVGGDPSKLVLNASADRLELNGRARFCGAIRAPAARVLVADDAQLFGSVTARRLRLAGRGQVHADSKPVHVLWTEE